MLQLFCNWFETALRSQAVQLHSYTYKYASRYSILKGPESLEKHFRSLEFIQSTNNLGCVQHNQYEKILKEQVAKIEVYLHDKFEILCTIHLSQIFNLYISSYLSDLCWSRVICRLRANIPATGNGCFGTLQYTDEAWQNWETFWSKVMQKQHHALIQCFHVSPLATYMKNSCQATWTHSPHKQLTTQQETIVGKMEYVPVSTHGNEHRGKRRRC